jgi:cell division protein FtsN
MITTQQGGYVERDTMSNKQVIAIFFAGVLLLVISFWVGLSIKRHNTAAAPVAAAASKGMPATGPNAQARNSDQQSPSPGTAEDDQNARFIVHVATFGTAEQADRLTRELRRKYLSADTQQPAQSGDTLYRVNIGPYKSRADAEQVARELQGEGRKGVMVLPQGGNK